MKTIAQRELRNRSGAILREAEAGEEFAITVDGRPVAVLGPYRRRQWVSPGLVNQLLSGPTDEGVLADLRRHGRGELDDPWDQ